MRTDFAAHWDELAEDVLSGMKEWRLQHPKATLRQIKAALDEHLGKLRAAAGSCGGGECGGGYQGGARCRTAGV